MSYRDRTEAGMRRIFAKTNAWIRFPVGGKEISGSVSPESDLLLGDEGGQARPDLFSFVCLKSDFGGSYPNELQEVDVCKEPIGDTKAWDTMQIKEVLGMRDQSSPSLTLRIGNPEV